MQLLVIRHAIAEERDPHATSDGDTRRPLTPEGANKMREVATGLRRLVERIDVIGASPLVRAQQTADIVAAAYGSMPVTTVPALSPGSDPHALASWLQQQDSASVVAAIGHEPDLGRLVTWLMTGLEESRVEMKKGGTCLLDVTAPAGPRSATLLWALRPSQLRRMDR
jgi:phosphohistidine phosphatase